jgi:hypothetical protein
MLQYVKPLQDIFMTEQHRHIGEIEYNLSTENRARIAAWGWPLVSGGLLAVSQFVPELLYPELAPITTGLIGLGVLASIPGKLGQNQLYVTGRILGDMRNALNSGRNERIRNLAKLDYETAIPPKALPIVNGDLYLQQIADNWDTHLALLSPTGTGKTRTLSTFLGLYTATRPCLVVAIEPKDNQWSDIDAANVLRISAKPTLENVIRLLQFTNALLVECDRRNDLIRNGGKIDFEIIVVLEEYLTTIKMIKVLFPDYHKELLGNLKALENIGRSSGIKVVLVSQSAVADDLSMSGGERSNFRMMLLGNIKNGFEAIEQAINNKNLVSNNDTRAMLTAQLERFLNGENGALEPEQPLMLCNMIGGWNIVKLEDSPRVKIASRVITLVAPELIQIGLTGVLNETPPDNIENVLKFAATENSGSVFAQTTVKAEKTRKPVKAEKTRKPVTSVDLGDLVVW